MTVKLTLLGMSLIALFSYLGVWLFFLLRYYYLLRIKRIDDAQQLAKIHRKAVLTGKWGWAIGVVFFMLMLFFLPTIKVVNQDIDRAKTKMLPGDTALDIRETFFIEEYAVLFNYHGHACFPTTSYIINETDSNLRLSSTTSYNGEIISSEDHRLPAGKFLRFPGGNFQSIKYQFPTSTPLYGQSRYDPTDDPFDDPGKHKPKKIKEWTIELESYDSWSGSATDIINNVNHNIEKQDRIKQ